jgi:intracellular sulfur oxidation DsrE/DsrF family protein
MSIMKIFTLGILLLFTTCTIQAQNRHKVVIQFTDSDSVSQASVLGQVKNIKNDLPDTDIEVVCHGPGLDLLVRKTSKVAAQIAEWKSKGVTFAACSNTMKRRGVKPEDLQQEATIVPSAMTQLIKRQEEGWSYVKGGH